MTTRCHHCGLPPGHCICDRCPALTSRCDFALLLHPQEVDSPTNTGRFLAQALPGTPLFTWQRTLPDPALLNWLNQAPAATFILFPCDRPALQPRRAELHAFVACARPRLLLLDGTWKQCRKMLRQSPWLDPFPLLALDALPPSGYRLRRGAGADQLCTLESAAAIMARLEEAANAASLNHHLARFCRHYRAFKSGHAP